MKKKKLRYKLYFWEVLGYMVLFSVCTMAQIYSSLNTVKNDTSKSDTSHVKKDTVGINIINIPGNNIYSVKEANDNIYSLDASITDTSITDTSRKKSDSLGFKEIKSPGYKYAFEGNTGSNYYFQYDSSGTDTSKRDTSKSDTIGYSRKNDFYLVYNNRGINQASGLNTKSNFLINPVKDLTQKLKLNVYLMDAQAVKVQEILREYEVRTYRSNGDHKELHEAAVNAQKDIADILTARQKKEWENSKNEWWASVNKALNLSSISKDKNNLE